MADVKIKIDIDANTAAIERVRAQLRSLCREVDDCTETHRKHTEALEDLSRARKKNDDDNEKTGKSFKTLKKLAKGFTSALRTLGKFGFMYAGIEAAAALVVIASAGILFKTGAFLAKAYQQSLVALSYGFAAVAAAAAAFLAAQRQFQSVQFAPQYAEGAINTEDRFKAASGAMKMFVDDASLAVIGTENLSKAFGTLSKNKPVTGRTVGVFRELSNYTAGMGGDLKGGTEALAKFLAEFQKRGKLTGSVRALGKELGPDFKKILKEVSAMGIKTFDEFSAAALKGELGETFAKKYAGQLNAVNSTVVAQFKIGLTKLKAMFTEFGEPMLGPLAEAIQHIVNSFQSMMVRIRGNVEDIGSGNLLDGLVRMIDKATIAIGRLVTRDIHKAGNALDWLKRGWQAIAKVFEKIQDYLRPLVPVASELWKVVKAILGIIGTGLNTTITMMSDLLMNTSGELDKFGEQAGKLATAWIDFAHVLAGVVIDILPSVANLIPQIITFLKIAGDIAKLIGQIFVVLEPAISGLLRILNSFAKILIVIAKAITYVSQAAMFLGKIVDYALNPILSIVKLITFGLVDLKNVAQTAIGTFIALQAAAYAAAAAQALGIGGKGFAAMAALRGGGMMTGVRGLAGKMPKGAGKVGNLAKAGVSRAAPLVKAAAPYAAVGAAGFGVGTLLGDTMFNANTTASRLGGGAVGAIGGAMTGAAIGSVILPGVGTAIGAAIGGFAGAIGGIMGAGKQRREAEKAAMGILKSYDSAITEAVKNGDVDALKEAASKANQELEAMAKSGKDGASAVAKFREAVEKLNKQAETYTLNATDYEFFSGQDADKMNEALLKMYGTQEAADKAAMESVINIFDVMRAGGEDVAGRWSAIFGDFNQSLVQMRLSMFDNKLQAIETQKAVNAAQRKLLEGDTSEEAVTNFLKEAYQFALQKTGGDALAAVSYMREHLNRAYGPGGTLDTVADKVKAGADKLGLFDPQKLIEQIIQSGQLDAQSRALATILGGAGMEVTADQASLQLRSLIGRSNDPAAMMDAINKLIQGGVMGTLTPQDLAEGFFTNNAGFNAAVATFNQRTLSNEADQKEWNHALRRSGGSGTPGAVIPPMNMQSIDIGGITIQVSGFISDPKVAEKLAQAVEQQIAARALRQGRSYGGLSAGPAGAAGASGRAGLKDQ